MTIALRYPTANARFAPSPRLDDGNVPREPLETLESAAGFGGHREWSARWRAVAGHGHLAEEYGGRGCDLIEWLIFEEEYTGAGAGGANQNGISCADLR